MAVPVKPKKEGLFAPALLTTGEYYAMVNMQPSYFFSNFSLKERLKVAGVYEPFFCKCLFCEDRKCNFAIARQKYHDCSYNGQFI